MTLLEKLDRLPPCFCRLLAKRNGELMTDREMVKLVGWERHKLGRISLSKSWGRISVQDVDIFLKACGVPWPRQHHKIWMLMRLLRKAGVSGLHRMRHLQKPIAQRATRVTTLLKRTEEVLSKNT